MKEITDPALLAELNAKEVTDPSLLAQLEGKPTESVPLFGKIGEAVSNVPSSFVNYVSNIAKTITNPKQVGEALAGLFTDSSKREAAKKAMIERYGGMEALGNTAVKDPVGLAGDLSTIFTGIGSIPRLGIIGKVGATIEPLTAGARATAKIVGSPASQVLGATTGKGGTAIKEAFAGKEGFTEGLRKKVGGEELGPMAKDALQQVAHDRSIEYTQKLSQLKQNQQTMDFTPVRVKYDSLLDRYGIKRNPDGTLDFSMSPQRTEKGIVGEIENLDNLIMDWETMPGNLTPSKMDVLKRQIDNFYAENHTTRALITELKNTVKSEIVARVPQYERMTKSYQEATQFIHEFNKAISTRETANIDTALTKMISGMRNDNQIRLDLLKALDEKTGGKLIPTLAGHTLSPWIPGGILGRSFEAGAALSLILGADPKIAFAFALATPRVVGEFVHALGQGARTLKKIPKPAITGAYQAGRIEEMTQ